MAGKNQIYAERYAEFAMEQMRLYGIPASVTLAQGILESANGQSRLAQNENNHFGIKALRTYYDNILTASHIVDSTVAVAGAPEAYATVAELAGICLYR